MARKLGNINPNEVLRSMVAMDIEEISVMQVLTAGTAINYAIQTEAPFMVIVSSGVIYFKLGTGASSVAGMRWPADVPLKIVKPSARMGHTGITAATVITANAADKTTYDVAAMTFKIDSAAYSKDAEAAVAFGSAWTINTGAAATAFWGAVLIQITAAGVVSDKVVTADQVFATEAEAIDALPAPDADNLAIGYITINVTASDTFTAGTETLAAADAAVVAINFVALSTPADVERFMGAEQLGPIMDSSIGQVVSFDADSADTFIHISEVH